MSRLRTLLLCFLMLALPFQGFAAAAMAACAVPQQAATQPSAQAHHHGRMHGEMHGEIHGAMQHAHGGEATAQEHSSPHELQADDSGGEHKCSACSVCHASAVVDTHTPVQAHAAPDASPSMRPWAVTSLAPSLPDKPPRA